MKPRLLATATMLLGVGLAWQSASADGILKRHHAKPACEPGFQLIEEIVLQEVTRTVCKMVPDTKKKWVYDWIDDPFCIHNTKHGHCPECSGPYCRKLLVKRHIELPCTTMKCVTETIVEKVPVTIYKKVPCATLGDAPRAEILAIKPMPTTGANKK